MNRRSTLAIGLLTLALAAGCGSGGSEGGEGGKAAASDSSSATPAALDRTDYNPQPYENIKDGGTYTTPYSFSGDDTQGMPWNVNASLTGQRIWNWYNPVAITYSPGGEVQINPDYYTEAKQSEVGGKQVVTLTINPKARYNDGTPIDWHSIEQTWKIASGQQKGYQIGSSVGYDQIESVKPGKDERQAVVTFSKPFAAWPSLFGTFLNPKSATVQNFNTAYSNKLQPQWGAGPFTVESYDPNSKKIVFVRNPQWWGRTARLQKRIYLDLPNSQANVNAFKNGQTDYTSASTAEAMNQLKNVPGSQIRQGGSPFQYYLFLNGKSALLSDVKVRHAVLAAVDRQQLAQIQFQGLDYSEPLPGSALFYSFQKGYHDNLSQVLTFGPEEAGKVLDEAGWKPGADGIREKDGKRLSIGYTLFGSDPTEKATAASIVAAEKKAGIEVKIQNTDPSEWATVINGNKFDMVISGNRSMDPYGQNLLGTFYGSKNPQNITRIGTAEVDQQIAEVSTIPNLDEQVKKANEVEVEAMKQYSLIPLFSGPSTYAVKKDLANVGATILMTPLPETIGYQK